MENLTKLISFYYHSLNRPQSDVHNYVEKCKMLLVELYDYYSEVYKLGRNKSRSASVSVYPTKFHPAISNITSQNDSFIGIYFSSSYVELDNYIKYHF